MPAIQLTDLCAILTERGFPATLDGPDGAVSAVNTLEDAAPGEISFLANERYLPALKGTRASAVILKDGIEVPNGLAAVRCPDPYGAVTVAVIVLHGYRRHPDWGVSDRAIVHETASVGKNPSIGPNVTIAAGVTLGDNCTLYPGCYLAEGVRLGNDCTLFPNVVVYEGCEIGNRVTIHAGSVIGEDGLGYAPHDGKWVKIPQVGRVVLYDDVEIGANCAIDRATLGKTEIGAGTKFGNVVVIGHGTKVGRDCIFVGVVGVAGSVKVGDQVTLAGHVGVAGHLTIGDKATVGAKAGVPNSVPAATTVLGSPAMPIHEFRRVAAAQKKLPELIKRVKELERQLEELRAQLARTS